jgi:peptidoglycan/xylan/chitin deacetylase (PgdA/CDA1 family)
MREHLRPTFATARPRERLPVLLYHHVGAAAGYVHPQLTVSPTAFARQVQWMKRRGFVAISAQECLAWLQGNQRLPERAVMLTFDDAFEDTARHAFPILRDHGFPATVFVVTDAIGGTQAWDEAPGVRVRKLMSREQILDWSRHGIEIGSHSRTHSDLATLDARSARLEIRGSCCDLSTLGLHVSTFAYPYGHYDANALALARSQYALGFTCDEGLNGPSHDPMLLRRTMVHDDDTWLDIEARLRLGYSPLRRMRTGLRLRTRIRKWAGTLGVR